MRVDLTWLRQAGFRFDLPELIVAVDPFLSDRDWRLHPPPSVEVLGPRLDWLLVTHGHGDHLDRQLLPQLAAGSPELQVVVPMPLVPTIGELAPGLRVHGVAPGDSIDLGPVRVEAVSAVHAIAIEDGYSDGRNSGEDPAFVGYLLHFGNVSVYHSGDTIVSTELLRDLAGRRVDVAILPVNGRDHFREEAGLVGNLSAREAVGLACRLGARLLIPMHHDLYRGNTERAGACADVAAETGAPIHVLALAPFISHRIA